MKKLKDTDLNNHRKIARTRAEERALAYEAMRGFKAILAYVERFSPEARRRMLSAANLFHAPRKSRRS